MSDLNVDEIRDAAATGAPDFPNGVTTTNATISGAATVSATVNQTGEMTVPGSGDLILGPNASGMKFVHHSFTQDPTAGPIVFLQTAFSCHGRVTLFLTDYSSAGDGAAYDLYWSNDQNSYILGVTSLVDAASLTVAANGSGGFELSGGAAVNDSYLIFGFYGGQLRDSVTFPL